MNKGSKAYTVTLCALFAALTAVFSWISVPIGPVPINLALLAVLLCGLILGPRQALIAVGVYILMGAVGVPVFAGFRGGAGVLLGPTGGYIVGYLPAAFISGLARERGGGHAALKRVAFMALGVAACYLLGSIWFAVLRKAALWDTLCLCVFPFLPGDALKVALAAFLAPRIDDVIRKM
ncbi:MAG: biotin transporter BioY [Clostridia bacterium]|nr:biotin transporter BioY [Clostridia bacterium]